MSFDSAVIGGGLAGTSAAITLAQQGLKVLLIEAKIYPQHKVCGEFLSPACTQYLKDLDALRAVQAVKPAYISGVTITSPRGVCWNTTFSGMGIGISRYALDQILINRAQELGVRVLEGTTVSNIQGNLKQGFTLTARSSGRVQSFQAKTVIVAHGKRSNLDRAFNRSFLNRPSRFLGLKSHFYGPPIPQRVELHTFTGGYCGLSEVEAGRTNVCLLVKQEVFQEWGNIDVFIRWMRQQNYFLDEWLSRAEQAEPEWHSISQIAFSRKSLVESDVLMTGDAARLIAPLAGDGMEMALRGGQIAAHAVNHFLDGRWTASELKRHYVVEWQQTFEARLRLARWLQTAVLNPALVTLGLYVLNSLPSLGEFIVKHTRDTELVVSSGA
jgi:flavin-dependent dehydrogenase